MSGCRIPRLRWRDDCQFCILLPKGVQVQVVTEHSEYLIVEWGNWFEDAVGELKS